MRTRVLETCSRCRRVGYDLRHLVLALDGRHELDATLCKACAADVEDAAKTTAAAA